MKRLILVSFVLSLAPFLPPAADGLTFEQLAAIRSVGSVELSPDGSRIQLLGFSAAR